MTSLTQLTKEILKYRGSSPKKYFSQNFLVDRGAYASVVEAGDISRDDYVIEVGPGLGFLTSELAKQAGYVTAVEIDEEMAEGLADMEAVSDNLSIVQGDILKIDKEDLPNFKKDTQYKVIANIPYHLTSKIFKLFLSCDHKPSRMVLLVQKEVAERVVAQTGDHTRLSLSIQLYSRPKIVRTVSKSSFYPQPKVDSAILMMEIDDSHIKHLKNEELFWRVVRIAFTGKRKKLINTLSNGLEVEKSYILDKLEQCSIETGSRPQHLSIDQWICFVNLLNDDKNFVN